MLPDFPELKQKLTRAIERYLRRRVREASLAMSVQQELLFEGDRLILSTEQGEAEQSLEAHSSEEYSISREELIRRGPSALTEVVTRMAEDLKKEQSATILQTVREAAEAAGQVVKRQGGSFDFDALMEGLEKIDIDFDENGEPYLINIVVSPDVAEHLKGQFPVWEANSEYEARYNELIARKRAEWNARESNRKLVD